MTPNPLPNSVPAGTPPILLEEHRLINIAREIAMDILPLEEVLRINGINAEKWAELGENPRFQGILDAEIADFRSALKTSDRVKLKAAAAVEEWLPELYARINDPREPLNAKIEGAKLLAKLGGVGEKLTTDSNNDRITITINMGAKEPIVVSAINTNVIDGAATEIVDS